MKTFNCKTKKVKLIILTTLMFLPFTINSQFVVSDPVVGTNTGLMVGSLNQLVHSSLTLNKSNTAIVKQLQTANVIQEQHYREQQIEKQVEQQTKLQKWIQSNARIVQKSRDIARMVDLIFQLYCMLDELFDIQIYHKTIGYYTCFGGLQVNLIMLRIEAKLGTLAAITTEILNTSGLDKEAKMSQLLDDTNTLINDMRKIRSDMVRSIELELENNVRRTENRNYAFGRMSFLIGIGR